MNLYLLNILCIIIWSILFSKHKSGKHNRTYFFYAVTIQILLFHALREPFAFPDGDTYAMAFDNIRQMSFSEAIFDLNRYTLWGHGYVLLNWGLGRICEDYHILFFATSTIIVLCTFWFYYKTSYNLLFSFLAFALYPFLMYQSMNAIRQHCAAAILLLSLYYIRNLKLSIPLFILSVSFHTTAIVFAPFYFIYNKLNKISPSKIIVFGILVLLIIKVGMHYFFQIVERYEHYQEIKNSNTLPLLVVGSVLGGHILNKTYKYKLDVHDDIVYKYLIYSTFILVGLTGTGGGRLASYFVYIMPVSLPMLFKYNKQQQSWKEIFAFIYMMALIYLWYSTTLNADFSEYHFLLQSL